MSKYIGFILVAITLVYCVTTSAAHADPSLPVFGSGPLTNLGEGGIAVENASAHVAWALAIPLLGQEIGGARGKWISGGAWIAFSLIQEAFFHAPANPGAAYPSEVRTDLITRIAPTVLVLTF